jgi:signal transduction histidine kinase
MSARRIFPRGVRGRLLVVVALVVGGALAVMTIGFNLLLARSLDGDATRLAHSRATTILSTLHVAQGRIVVSDAPDDAAIDSQSWIYRGARAIEQPRASRQAGAAARSLVVSNRRQLDVGDLRLYAVPVSSGGARVGTVVAGVSLAPYEQTRKTALELSAALALALFAVVLTIARSLLSHALHPVSVMTREAAEWSEEESDRRFAQGPPYDELTELAATLDGLLDRLAASLRHERLFSAELSHELRTPLARILARSELMLARPRGADDYREALEGIRGSATQMTRTVETLVDEARLQVDGRRGSCDLADVLATVVRSARETARTHGCTIEVGPDEAHVRVGASADLVERIIQPVVENACSYGSTEVRISVVQRSASRVELRVADDGSGIDADERERVFEPGFRGRASGANERGAGLGLALARRLATSAGATIVAAQPTRGGGLVVVELPTT